MTQAIAELNRLKDITPELDDKEFRKIHLLTVYFIYYHPTSFIYITRIIVIKRFFF